MGKKVLKISLIILLLIIVFCAVCAFSWLIAYLNADESNLPRIDIEADGKIDSKDEYVDCIINVSNTDDEYEINDASAKIKGRGNTTWKYPKKPYRIKFDTKVSLFGNEENKSWVLLAMYNDFSLSKDALAFSLGASLENGDYVPSYEYVEVYLNGIYQGLYLLTEHINENEGRTNVKYDFDEDDTEVPFIVELDAYAELDGGVLGEDYFKIGDLFYTVKYPDKTERYTDEQFKYIEGYIKKVHSLCYKKNVTIDELSQYIDIESFIDYYLMQEIMIQADIDYKSVYMYKSIDGKLKMGPLWDYDWALDGPSLLFWLDYELKPEEYVTKGTWFYGLLNGAPEFKEAVKARWDIIEDKIRLAASEFEAENAHISNAAHKDWLRWHYYNYGACYKPNFDNAYRVLIARINWLDNEINNW
ncbi:MAG: CotH kinase family protein [Clostridia bacterium]|nr:CotH kinase family protein [Clostridia bacterium]